MEERLIRLEERQNGMIQDMTEIKAAVKDIASYLKKLTILEAKHGEVTDAVKRAFTRIDDHEVRIRKVEDGMPTIQLSSKWVFASVTGVIALLLGIIAKLVLFQ